MSHLYEYVCDKQYFFLKKQLFHIFDGVEA